MRNLGRCDGMEFTDKIFHRPDEHPEPHSLLKSGVLARAKTACRHSYQGMNFGAYPTLDLGAALNRKGGLGVCEGVVRRGKTGAFQGAEMSPFFFSTVRSCGLDILLAQTPANEQRGVRHLSRGGVSGVSGQWTRGPFGARDRAPW